MSATTVQSKLSEFPPGETYGRYLALGRPTFHMRVSPDVRILQTKDKRTVAGEGVSELFISSSAGRGRNNVVVQRTGNELWGETVAERVTRVLFAHLNAVVFSYAKFLKASEEDAIRFDRAALKEGVSRMLARFGSFKFGTPEDPNDPEFGAAMSAFASAYEGRADELTAKLAALAADLDSPTLAQKAGEQTWGLFELILTTSIKAAVEGMAKFR